jgi:hypothetical protein
MSYLPEYLLSAMNIKVQGGSHDRQSASTRFPQTGTVSEDVFSCTPTLVAVTSLYLG